MGLFENVEYFERNNRKQQQQQQQSSLSHMDYMKLDLQKQEQIPLRCVSSTVLNETTAAGDNTTTAANPGIELLESRQQNSNASNGQEVVVVADQFERISQHICAHEKLPVRIVLTGFNLYVMWFMVSALVTLYQKNILDSILIANMLVQVGMVLSGWIDRLKLAVAMLVVHFVQIVSMAYAIYCWQGRAANCNSLSSCRLDYIGPLVAYCVCEAGAFILLAYLIERMYRRKCCENERREDEAEAAIAEQNTQLANESTREPSNTTAGENSPV
jgi:hypothetical protein